MAYESGIVWLPMGERRLQLEFRLQPNGGNQKAELQRRSPVAVASGSQTSDFRPLTNASLEFSRMADTLPARPELLTELENRQEQVLQQLAELNKRIEQAVSLNRLQVKAADQGGRSVCLTER
jgi:hypothetical protein